jgi:hypothetical protein
MTANINTLGNVTRGLTMMTLVMLAAAFGGGCAADGVGGRMQAADARVAQPARNKAVLVGAPMNAPAARAAHAETADSEVCDSRGWKDFIAAYEPTAPGRNAGAVYAARPAAPRTAPLAAIPAVGSTNARPVARPIAAYGR